MLLHTHIRTHFATLLKSSVLFGQIDISVVEVSSMYDDGTLVYETL